MRRSGKFAASGCFVLSRAAISRNIGSYFCALMPSVVSASRIAWPIFTSRSALKMHDGQANRCSSRRTTRAEAGRPSRPRTYRSIFSSDGCTTVI